MQGADVWPAKQTPSSLRLVSAAHGARINNGACASASVSRLHVYKQTARAVFRSLLGSLARTPPSGFYRGPESSSAAGRSPSITLARGQIKMHNGRVQHIYYWTGDKRAIYRAEKCDSTLLSGHLKPPRASFFVWQ